MEYNKNDHLIKILDIRKFPDYVFIITEYFSGGSLKNMVDTSDNIPTPEDVNKIVSY